MKIDGMQLGQARIWRDNIYDSLKSYAQRLEDDDEREDYLKWLDTILKQGRGLHEAITKLLKLFDSNSKCPSDDPSEASDYIIAAREVAKLEKAFYQSLLHK